MPMQNLSSPISYDTCFDNYKKHMINIQGIVAERLASGVQTSFRNVTELKDLIKANMRIHRIVRSNSFHSVVVSCQRGVQ